MPTIDTPGGQASLEPPSLDPRARRTAPDAAPRAPAELLDQLRDRLAQLPDNHPSRPPAHRESPGPEFRAAGYPEAGYPEAGYPEAGYPAAGYPEAGYPEAGYPEADPELAPEAAFPTESAEAEPGAESAEPGAESAEAEPGAESAEPGAGSAEAEPVEHEAFGQKSAEWIDPGPVDDASAVAGRYYRGRGPEHYEPWFLADSGAPWFVLDDPS